LQDIFVPMISEPPPAAQSAAPPALSSAVSKAIAQHYQDSGAFRFGISAEQFLQFVTAVVTKYAADASESDQLELLSKLQLQDLVLARACSSGNDPAWETFLLRFRSPLYETAYRIARNEATGREIADELYADLYGIPNREGRRVSKLDYYMGRGSLEGWLRTVLSQHYIDRCRSHAKTVSLEEQIESGASFPAPAESSAAAHDPRLATAIDQTLDELTSEDRFILASYYLDQRTLAQLARQLHVHESTMSRRLSRITAHLQRRTLKYLRNAGLSARQCEELLHDIDVRDLNLDVARKLRQETSAPAFYNKDGNKDGSAT
jgi:RNA polymerase sigma-70 factor (ECF subfamily)